MVGGQMLCCVGDPYVMVWLGATSRREDPSGIALRHNISYIQRRVLPLRVMVGGPVLDWRLQAKLLDTITVTVCLPRLPTYFFELFPVPKSLCY
jgi:hypothetical protein